MTHHGAVATITRHHPLVRAALDSVAHTRRAWRLEHALAPVSALAHDVSAATGDPGWRSWLPAAVFLDALDPRLDTAAEVRWAWLQTVGWGSHAAMARVSGQSRWWTGVLADEQARLAFVSWLEAHLSTGRPDLTRLAEARLAQALWMAPPPGCPHDALDAHVRVRLEQPRHLDESGAWEANRSGFQGHPTLTGDLFGPMVLAETIGGARGRAMFRAVADRRPDARPVYYRELPEMPADTDDAAAIVLAAHTLAMGPTPLIERSVRVLAGAPTEDGCVRTWVQLPDAPLPSPPIAAWYGPACPGVTARALQADRVVGIWSAATRARVETRLRQHVPARGPVASPHYPHPVLATALVHSALSDPHLPTTHWLLHAPRSTAHAEADRALALAQTNSLGRSHALDALATLLALERHDGTWGGSDWFVCPHPGGELRPLRCDVVATARAERAIRLLWRQVARGPRAADGAEARR